MTVQNSGRSSPSQSGEDDESIGGRSDRHVLVGVRRLRERGAGGAFPQLGIGVFGIAVAFGLTVVTMAYAIGHISGCHLNPAVSVGLMLSKRFPAHEVPGYIAAQVIGAILGAGVLYLIATGRAGFVPGGFASNGYGATTPRAAIRCWPASAPKRSSRLCFS
jgi:glycerol uptake facilitator-like aquaporin